MTLVAVALLVSLLGSVVAVCLTVLRYQRERLTHAPVAQLEKRLEATEAQVRTLELKALKLTR